MRGFFNNFSIYNYYNLIKLGSKQLDQTIDIKSTFNNSDYYIETFKNISIKNIYNPKIFLSLP